MAQLPVQLAVDPTQSTDLASLLPEDSEELESFEDFFVCTSAVCNALP